MRVTLVILALACAALASETTENKPASAEPVVAAASEPEKTVTSAKSSRSNDPAPKVYYARPAQARDGAHHHHDHGHDHSHDHSHDHGAAAAGGSAYAQQPAPQAYSQPAPAYDQAAAPQAYAPQAPQGYDQQQAYAQPAPQAYDQPQAYSAPASYDQPAAPAYPAPAPAASAYPAPAAYESPAPAYSTPGHHGYYYYYYPVKDSKAKLKLPKLPKMPSFSSLPSLHLPEYIGKDGGVASVKSLGVAAITAAVVGIGAFLSLPIIGLGVGKRSFNSIWESEYLSRDNLNVLADYVLKVVDTYQQKYNN